MTASCAPSLQATTSRKSATAAASRLFKPLGAHKQIKCLKLIESTHPCLKLNTSIVDILVPSDRTSPACLCCSQSCSWAQMIQGHRKLKLGLSGAYACCHECASKNGECLPENKRWLLVT